MYKRQIEYPIVKKACDEVLPQLNSRHSISSAAVGRRLTFFLVGVMALAALLAVWWYFMGGLDVGHSGKQFAQLSLIDIDDCKIMCEQG